MDCAKTVRIYARNGKWGVEWCVVRRVSIAKLSIPLIAIKDFIEGVNFNNFLTNSLLKLLYTLFR